MFGVGIYETEVNRRSDTDLTFTCLHCNTQVMIGGELGFRSADAKTQGIARLCTRCWYRTTKQEETSWAKS